ncbi:MULTISPECIES: UDP-N-acetylmuramate dehydrogenase [Fusobacterium]|uniref:UDP-N-acetylmuramate dehydrogenase n=1 Tax=Fusobacterium TaxID=848 RepID=UPI001476C483|nr:MULTISPECIES: UDP-N-acetylmuramate dehydrogenase [Fusobacterium]NME36001.1 UDP-N-acetylmuramate dehydrogenase [Fusobacterium sp. FSA-380-WT-3A]
MIITKNYNMKNHSSIKIGGVARQFIEIENKEELYPLLKNLKNYFIIGNGTNLLLSDDFLDLNFISLKKLRKISIIDENRINVEAGLDFPLFLNYLEKNNLSGLEELIGIPGTVGGLIFMNGGAHGREIFDCIESIEILDEKGNISIIEKKDLKIGYRYTEIKEHNWIVLSANFIFQKNFNKELTEEIKNKRKNSQPLEFPNLGSTFKNPSGFFAAKLISESGLQGHKIGGAQISTKHSNFIVNVDGATFSDVTSLIKLVEKTIKEKYNINLEKEIIVLK